MSMQQSAETWEEKKKEQTKQIIVKLVNEARLENVNEDVEVIAIMDLEN